MADESEATTWPETMEAFLAAHGYRRNTAFYKWGGALWVGHAAVFTEFAEATGGAIGGQEDRYVLFVDGGVLYGDALDEEPGRFLPAETAIEELEQQLRERGKDDEEPTLGIFEKR